MDLNKTANRLIEIRAQMDLLKKEQDALRELLPVGFRHRVEGVGDVTLYEQNRTKVDGFNLYNDLKSAGVNPDSLGEVSVKINKDLLDEKRASGYLNESVRDMISNHTETKKISALKVTVYSKN